CSIWALMIRQAILTGKFDPNEAIKFLPEERRERWQMLSDAAMDPEVDPRRFAKDSSGRDNGWVVLAYQCALASVAGALSVEDALYRAIRAGGDTDTIAAI